MVARTPAGALFAAVLCTAVACPCAAQDRSPPSGADNRTQSPSTETLALLSIDVRTLPQAAQNQAASSTPRWRTSFGSERRSEPSKPAPSTGVDADIVLLQGVTDVPTLRRWFPAGQWRLVVSRQMTATTASQEAEPATAPRVVVPTTAVAVRLRAGLRMTGQDHLLELANSAGQEQSAVTAAGTAVRVLIDGRQTWAVSVLLPENCGAECPGRTALAEWHAKREQENIRRVTGGRFQSVKAADPAGTACSAYGLRLDPAPPPPRQAYVSATETALLGCAASVTVAK